MITKYSDDEKSAFINIVGQHPIVENKKTDSYNIDKKKKAWDKITEEFNKCSEEKRSVIQLKRLWDKMKRQRKIDLAEERRNVMQTGGGPQTKLPPNVNEVDIIAPHLNFEIENTFDSDGIALASQGNRVIECTTKEGSTAKNAKSCSEVADYNDVSVTKAPSSRQHKELEKVSQARLELNEIERHQLKELHEIRMEVAKYKRDAAKLIFDQEQFKLMEMQKQ